MKEAYVLERDRMVTHLEFTMPDGGHRRVSVKNLLNAGYAGRDQAAVAAHIDELAAIGIAGPDHVPTLYRVAPSAANQGSIVWSQNGKTSGEVECVLVVDDGGDLLITVGSDHTDRALEVHGIPWGKQIAHDVVATQAWLLSDVADHIDELELSGWVRQGGGDFELMQHGTTAQLLPLRYWLDVLTAESLLQPGTLLFTGTLAMIAPNRQYAPEWKVQLTDPVLRRSIGFSYQVEVLNEIVPPAFKK
jgi:2-keto-4-pentenoate hydratase/2-oxohepta-3-ene-1,7-dioic acid hydratase in catechol pathway